MESEENRKVCVTGGTGFLGSWLIKRLLDHGYSVTTTVRSNPDLSFLTSLPGASERLEIFAADLNDPRSFGAAIEGCAGVFHVATPVDFENKEPEEVVTKRSIDGALSILDTCLNSEALKRVVYTSSASAVTANGEHDGLSVVDERFWSSVDFVRDLKVNAGPYMISKTMAEKAVLEFSERTGLEVVTLVPSVVVGPFVCPKLPSSIQDSFNLVFGKNKDTFGFGTDLDVVHVDDVARAHIFLFEHPEANGRYICSLKRTSVKSVSAFLGAKYPELNIPTNKDSENEWQFKFPSLSSKKLLDSGFEFKYGVEEMFDDAIKCCKEKGYICST